MEKHFIKNITILKKAILERKLVVFAGAGVSVDAGVPFWETLIKELQKEIDVPESEKDYLKLAQMYFNERNQKEFLDKIREVLKHKKTRYNEIHEAIVELNPEHIITTNFDDLFEQVIKAKAQPFSVVKKDNEFPYANNTKLLVKAHGDLDEGNLVLKEDDFLEYAKNHPLIENFIKGIFSNKVVLFIGYSFSDINLKIILQSVRNVLSADFQNAYLLSVDDEVHQAQRQYLKQKGITVVNYNDAGNLHDANAIEQYLYRGHNAFGKEFEKKPKTLSEKGVRLYSLIKFIVRYMDFKEAIAKEDPVNQMFLSLYRFMEIKSLPPNFLANLYPFNRWGAYIHNYHSHTLASNNKAITEFFFEDFNPNDGSVKPNYFQKHSINHGLESELNDKLHFVLKKMNFSGIFSFGKPGERLHTFEIEQDMPHKVSVHIKGQSCNCLSCLYNNFRLKEFLQDIKIKSITDTTEVLDDFLLAYSNYKIGNFKAAFSQFDQIANKSWHLGKYLSYYTAKRNAKYLRNMVGWSEDDSHSEHTRSIIEKIEDIDLDKLLFHIPNLDSDEYELLKTIRDNDILLRAENKISEAYDNLTKIYYQYKNGEAPSSSYFPILICEQLDKIVAFYNYNCIVKDEYTNFTRVVRKAIHALMICYAIPNNYRQRLQAFHFEMVRLMIFYGSDSEMNEAFNELEIEVMKVEDKSVDKLFSYLINLFESLFSEVHFAGRHVNEDRNVSAHAKGFFFQDKLRHFIHNALLIFARVEVPEKYGKKVVRIFLDFLSVQDILIFYSGRYLVHFLHNIRAHFEFKEFVELLQKVIETDIELTQTEFYLVVAKGITENYPETVIEDKRLVKAIIKKCINPALHRRDLSFMYLYDVSSEEIKKIIVEAIKESLLKKFDSIDYLNACLDGILSITEFNEQYVKLMEDHASIDTLTWEGDKPIRHGGIHFPNWIHALYSLKVSIEDFNYPAFESYPDYYKFYLNPYSFDYTGFDARWLLIINRPYAHHKLSEIPQVALYLKRFLKENYNEPLAKIYAQYYLNKSEAPASN